MQIIISKPIKRIVTFILTLSFVITLGSLIPQSPTKPVAVRADSSQVDIALATGRSLIGSTAYNGYCQRFVRICYEAAGIEGWAGSAAVAASYWMVSASRNDIPVGATLYFNSDSIYGHVGIYTGGGNILHALSTVTEEPISDYWWDRFIGWGYQGGVIPSGCVIEPDITAPSIGNVYLAVAGETGSQYFTMTGTVSDDRALGTVTFALTDESGKIYYYSASVDGQTASAYVSFEELGNAEGNYSLSITALDASGNQASLAGNSAELALPVNVVATVRHDLKITFIDRAGTYDGLYKGEIKAILWTRVSKGDMSLREYKLKNFHQNNAIVAGRIKVA